MRPILFAFVVAAAGCASAGRVSSPPVPFVPPSAPEPQASAVPEGDAVNLAVGEFRDFLKTYPESEALIARIDALALLKDPRVAKVLAGVFGSPVWSESARAAACRAAGRQGDRRFGLALLGFAEGKEVAARPELLAAALDGAGEADPQRCNQHLLSYGRKYLDRDAVVAAAAFRGAARCVTPDTVDLLVRELSRASHVRIDDLPSKRAARDAIRPVLADLLQGMTGKEFADAKDRAAWWKDHRKTWKPGDLP